MVVLSVTRACPRHRKMPTIWRNGGSPSQKRRQFLTLQPDRKTRGRSRALLVSHGATLDGTAPLAACRGLRRKSSRRTYSAVPQSSMTRLLRGGPVKFPPTLFASSGPSVLIVDVLEHSRCLRLE